MSYDITHFRNVRHGLEDETAHCRMCDWNDDGIGAAKKARIHAKQTLHTVDVYREHWTELTSHVSDDTAKEANP